MPEKMVQADEFAQLAKKNFDRIQVLKGDSYKDRSTMIIMPTRGLINHRVVSKLMGLITPTNQRRAMLLVQGDEVGEAYNKAIKATLDNETKEGRCEYLMTIEDDNLVPHDAHVRLIQAIEKYDFEAVSGLYYSKGEFGFPMAFGNPSLWKSQGILDFAPREDIGPAMEKDNILEVNGIAMGCAVYKMEVFRSLAYPWFKTWQNFVGDNYAGQTQDLYFCENVRRAGGRLAVHCGVRVGHLDKETGEVW